MTTNSQSFPPTPQHLHHPAIGFRGALIDWQTDTPTLIPVFCVLLGMPEALERKLIFQVCSLISQQGCWALISHTKDPTPLLNIHLRRVDLPIEEWLIKATRKLTSPWLIVLLGAAYIIALAFFAREQSFLTPAESFIGCTATYWIANDGCGLDGQLCAPYDNTTFDFRCPAQCSSVILQNPRTVGDEQIAFKPLLVGGGDPNKTYRGDSFICAAAVQACVVNSRFYTSLTFLPTTQWYHIQL